MSDKVYKRKARPKIYVQAFIFGYDETPEWFTNCKRVCIPQRLIYENGKTLSFAPGNYICRNLDGTMRFSKGDYIIRNQSGEIYPCKYDIFIASYEKV